MGPGIQSSIPDNNYSPFPTHHAEIFPMDESLNIKCPIFPPPIYLTLVDKDVTRTQTVQFLTKIITLLLFLIQVVATAKLSNTYQAWKVCE